MMKTSTLHPILCRILLTGAAVFLFLAPIYAQPLEGNYTINSAAATENTNFQSFNDLANALETEGISGPVTVTVEPGSGPYNEQVEFTTITGSSADAVFTLEGNGETLTALTSTDSRYLMRLTDLSHVHINNLHLLRDIDATSGFYGIHIFNSGNHITLSNCSTDMTGTSSTLVGAYICSGGETSILAAGDFHIINILDNYSTGGGYGASVYGEGDNLSSNIVIDGNTFHNFHSNGVYLRETDGVEVSNNHFNRIETTPSSSNAIQLAQNANINGNIFNNFIEHSDDSNGNFPFRGIYVFNGTGHRVFNNVIHNIHQNSGEVVGIEVRASGIAPEISFNTISFSDTAASIADLFGIKEELSNTNSVLRNNIVFIQQTTTGIASALVLGSVSDINTAFDSDYNDLYVPDGNVGQRGTLSPTFYTSLIQWQNASGQDENSFSADPDFVSDLMAIPTNAAINDLGIAITGIETDILGNVRNDPPDVGAYEFNGCLPPMIGEISGVDAICAGETSFYSVNTTPDILDVLWQIEGDAIITDSTGATGIFVEFGSGSVIISVSAEDSCGIGEATILNVTVQENPQVEFEMTSAFACFEGESFELTGGTPAGGIYSGPGVINDQFVPDAAGVGIHTLTYTFADSLGCSDSAQADIEVVICTGIDDANSNVSAVLFPNPVNNLLQINLESKISSQSEIFIFDASGKVVFQQTISIVSGQQMLTFPVENLSAGNYVFSMIHEEFRIQKEFVKRQ